MSHENAFSIDYFIAQKGKTPQNIALIWEENEGKFLTITYEELWRESQQLAQALTKFCSIHHLANSKPIRAGILLPRQKCYIVALLALWQAGMSYVPLLDASANTFNTNEAKQKIVKKRIESIGEDNLAFIISSHAYNVKKEEKALKIFDFLEYEKKYTADIFEENMVTPEARLSKEEEAYIFFSSGTMGTPKVISIPHDGIYDRIHSAIEIMEVKSSETVLNFTGYDFDPSLMEIFMAFCTGATLCIVPERVRVNQYLLPEFLQQLEKAKHPNVSLPSHAILVPSVLKQLQPSKVSCLKSLLITGENYDKAWLENWFNAECRIFNGYGPTETTFGAVLVEIKNGHSITINRAMKGIQLYLAPIKSDNTEIPSFSEWLSLELALEEDKSFTDLEENEREIYIGGNGLGKYVGNSVNANQNNFIEHDKQLYFRTKDIAKIQKTESGKELIFIGRNDRVFKYHGKWVSLDALEAECSKALQFSYKVYVIEYRNPHHKFENTNVVIALIERKTPSQNIEEEEEEKEIQQKLVQHFKNREFKPILCCLVNKLEETHNGKAKKDLNDLQHCKPKIFYLYESDKIKLKNQDLISMNQLWVKTVYAFKSTDIFSAIKLIVGEEKANKYDSLENSLIQFSEEDKFSEIGGDSLQFTTLKNYLIEDIQFPANSSGDLLEKCFKENFINFHRLSLREMTLYFVLYKKIQIKFEEAEDKNVYFLSFGSSDDVPTYRNTNINSIRFNLIPYLDLYKPDDISIVAKLFMELITFHGGKYPVILTHQQTNSYGASLQQKIIENIERKLGLKIKFAETYPEVDLEQAIKVQAFRLIEEKVCHSINYPKPQAKSIIISNGSKKFYKDIKVEISHQCTNSADTLKVIYLDAANPLVNTALLQDLSKTLRENKKVVHLSFGHLKEQADNLKLYLGLDPTQWQIFQAESKEIIWLVDEVNVRKGNMKLEWMIQSLESFTHPQICILGIHTCHYFSKDKLQWKPKHINNIQVENLSSSLALNPSQEETLPFLESGYVYQPDKKFLDKTPTWFWFHPVTGDGSKGDSELVEVLKSISPQQPIYRLTMRNDMLEHDLHTIEKQANAYYELIEKAQPSSDMPFYFIGWSYGGLLAFQTALIAERRGREVEVVINIDCLPPMEWKKTLPSERALFMINYFAEKGFYLTKNEMSPIFAEELKEALKKSIEEIKASFTPKEIIYTIFSSAITFASTHGQDRFAQQLKYTQINLSNSYSYCESKERLKASYYVFEAIQKTSLINDGDFKKWGNLSEHFQLIKIGENETEEAQASDHFNLFFNKKFQPNCQQIVNRHYAVTDGRSLEIRLKEKAEEKLKRTIAEVDYYYVHLYASKSHNPTDKETLQAVMRNFLENTEHRVIFIEGVSGAGKSTYTRQLYKTLLKNFTQDVEFNHNEKPVLFPILISMNEYADMTLGLNQSLLSAGFNLEERKKSVQSSALQFVFIFDDYNKDNITINFYDTLRKQFPNAKVILTLKKNVIGSEKRYSYFTENLNQILSYIIHDFDENQIAEYVSHAYPQLYRQNLDHLSCEKLIEKIIKFTDDEENVWAKTPLGIRLALESEEMLGNRNTSRFQLYQAFVQKKFTHYWSALPSLIQEDQKLKHELKGQAEEYAKNLVENNKKDIREYDEAKLRILLPLNIVNEEETFSHATWKEFYCAIIGFEEIKMFADTHYYSAIDWMKKYCLQEERSLMGFICDQINACEKSQSITIIHGLLTLISYSRQQTEKREKIEIVAGNAVTILNGLQFPFSRLNLSNVSLKNPDFRDALVYDTNFNNAHMVKPDFSNAAIYHSSFKSAAISDPYFEDLPSKTFRGEIICAAQSPLSTTIAFVQLQRYSEEDYEAIESDEFFCASDYTKLEKPDLRLVIWDLAKQLIIEEITLEEAPLCISYSSDGKMLYLLCKYNSKQLETDSLNHSYFIKTVSVAPLTEVTSTSLEFSLDHASISGFKEVDKNNFLFISENNIYIYFLEVNQFEKITTDENSGFSLPCRSTISHTGKLIAFVTKEESKKNYHQPKSTISVYSLVNRKIIFQTQREENIFDITFDAANENVVIYTCNAPNETPEGEYLFSFDYSRKEPIINKKLIDASGKILTTNDFLIHITMDGANLHSSLDTILHKKIKHFQKKSVRQQEFIGFLGNSSSFLSKTNERNFAIRDLKDNIYHRLVLNCHIIAEAICDDYLAILDENLDLRFYEVKNKFTEYGSTDILKKYERKIKDALEIYQIQMRYERQMLIVYSNNFIIAVPKIHSGEAKLFDFPTLITPTEYGHPVSSYDVEWLHVLDNNTLMIGMIKTTDSFVIDDEYGEEINLEYHSIYEWQYERNVCRLLSDKCLGGLMAGDMPSPFSVDKIFNENVLNFKKGLFSDGFIKLNNQLIIVCKNEQLFLIKGHFCLDQYQGPEITVYKISVDGSLVEPPLKNILHLDGLPREMFLNCFGVELFWQNDMNLLYARTINIAAFACWHLDFRENSVIETLIKDKHYKFIGSNCYLEDANFGTKPAYESLFSNNTDEAYKNLVTMLPNRRCKITFDKLAFEHFEKNPLNTLPLDLLKKIILLLSSQKDLMVLSSINTFFNVLCETYLNYPYALDYLNQLFINKGENTPSIQDVTIAKEVSSGRLMVKIGFFQKKNRETKGNESLDFSWEDFKCFRRK